MGYRTNIHWGPLHCNYPGLNSTVQSVIFGDVYLCIAVVTVRYTRHVRRRFLICYFHNVTVTWGLKPKAAM